MTEKKLKAVRPRLEALVAQDRDLLKALVKEALDQILQAEMTEFLGAAPGERSGDRLGYRAGYYERGLVTRVGKIELRVAGVAGIQAVEAVPTHGEALFALIVEQDHEGIVAKRLEAAYLARRHPTWLKIKNRNYSRREAVEWRP